MENESDSESKKEPIGAIPRSFSNRGPNKRKVKPTIEAQLIQFQTMFSDSEDDEDFVASSDEDDDDMSDHSGDEANKGNKSSSDLEENEENASKDDENFVENEDESESEESIGDEHDENDMTISDSLITFQEADTSSKERSKPKKSNLPVCGICLENESTEADELVECDWCGITVHEGCYGDANDDESDDKSDSDADTEPWFCDACKAKCSRHCELCPVEGGILKQADNGQWVHLICALYVPGVGFRDVDRLQTVVLDDISANRWSARECSLCEDKRFSKTGICIQCDAGLCKTFFHVSCAQKHGLLIEAPAAGHLNDDDADPLYAHCKMHTDKNVMRHRISHWNSFETHIKDFNHSCDPDEKLRIDSAFKRAQEEYLEFRRSLTPAILQTVDTPRLLSSCPEISKFLLKKAELRGYSTTSEEIALPYSGNSARPSLSNDFVNHFLKRETLVSQYQSKEMPFRQIIENKKEEQRMLQDLLENLKVDLEKCKATRNNLFKSCTLIHSALEKISGRKMPLPNVLKPKKKQRKVSDTVIESVIKACTTCNGTHDQHLLALCDTCNNYYHIGCLDPPLTALPKKGLKWIWQCTECDKSDSEVSIDDEGPSSRKRKRKSNAPKKFTPVEEKAKKRKQNGNYQGKGRGRKRAIKMNENDKSLLSDENIEENIVVVKVPERKGRKKKVAESLDPCYVCSKDGDSKNTVRCDDCHNCFHFDCCEPKLKGNPKKRGYMWFCNDCVDSEEDDDCESNEGKDEKPLSELSANDVDS